MGCSDRVKKYALGVQSGEIVAGPHIRAACERNLDDLEKAPNRGFFFDEDKANRAFKFFETVCKLNGGEFEGLPFKLLDWQAFIIGSLFGWVKKNGMRRFRVAYVETGKGSGKSPLSAGIGLYGLVADGEPRAEIYAAATKKDQAMILFRDAVAMYNLSELLNKNITKSGGGLNVWNLSHLKSGSFFRPISADDSQSGPRPHIALLDEVHEHKTDNVVEMMRAGTKGRRQALVFMITNSGSGKNSVCWNYHEYGGKVADQLIQDDSFFSFICSLDEGDDPFNDESCWGKANPSLGITIPHEYLREQVTQAKGMPSKEAIVRRLNFCEWVEAHNPWLSVDAWKGASDEYSIDMLMGRECYGGLDLGSTQDLNALVLIFPPIESDDNWYILPYFWLPNEGLADKADKDGVPYLAWRDAGFLETTEGRAVNKLIVAHRLAEIASQFDIRAIAYDRWRIEDLKIQLDNEGIDLNLLSFGQGFKDMAPAIDHFEELLLAGKIKHNNNPLMTWCASNAVVDEDPAGNRKMAKNKATGRIDGVVAAVMGVSTAVTAQDSGSYEIFFV